MWWAKSVYIHVQYLAIIHRSGGEEWWIFTKPQNGKVNIHQPQ